MYVYDFDYNPTNAARNQVASSAELPHFQPTYSNRRKVRAADYFNAAEGGEVADAAPADAGIAGGMSGASKAAFDYLMGNAPTSRDPARMEPQLMQGIGPAPMASQAPVVGGDNMYAFDPATGTFLRNPNVPGAATSGSRIGTSLADFGGGGGGYEPAGPNPDFDTPEKQAAYYAENPTMGAVTRAGQTALGFLPGGSALFAAQEYMDPGFRQAQENLTYGVYVDPATGMGHYAGSLDSNGGVSGHDYGGGGYDAGSGVDTSYGYGGYFAEGGITSLAKGGMKSGGFVFPADALSALGNGSTDAGLRKLNAMMGGGVTLIKGNGDGLSDSIPTNIDGKQPARVADGEAYIDPAKVKEKGGAKVLYALMDKVRKQAHGKTTQQRKVNPGKVMA
jgi:hypothetical protein